MTSSLRLARCSLILLGMAVASFTACDTQTGTQTNSSKAEGQVATEQAPSGGESAALTADPADASVEPVSIPRDPADAPNDADVAADPDIDPDPAQAVDATFTEPKVFPPLPPPEGLQPLTKDKYKIWIDPKQKAIVLDGEICLNEGMLELFACEEGMKTHESVVAVKAKPSLVHAALLALGAWQGKPVQFNPEYRAASGAEVDITVQWKDEEGKWHSKPAQHFVRNVKTKKEMTHPWVFSGSFFWKDQVTGQEIYMGDSSGDFICVSNFNTATLDIPVESTATNEGLVYEAFKEHIPPRGTKVRVTLKPRFDKPKPADPATEKKPDDAPAAEEPADEAKPADEKKPADETEPPKTEPAAD